MVNTLVEKDKNKQENKTTLPQGWVECSFNEICDVRDGTHDSPKYVDVGYPLVTSKNLKSDKVTFDNIKLIKEEDYNKINERSKVDIGDVLFAMIGTIGNPVVICKEPNYAIKNVALFKKSESIIPKFLKYYLDTSFVQTKMQSEAKGSTQKFVGLGYIRGFKIKLPPLAEQERIVEKIEELFSDIEEGVKSLEKAKLQIKQYKQSVLKSAFDGKLYKTTEWKEETLEDVLPLLYGKSLTAKDRIEGSIPVYASSGIVGHHNKSLIIHPCLIVGRKGGVGSVYFNEKPCWVIDTAYYTDASIKTNLKFAYYLLKSLNLSKLDQSTAIPGLSRDLYNKTRVKISTDSIEQQKIVEEIEKRFEVADILEQTVNDGLEKAKQLKQSILKKAFEGKLVSQDPNDEPASILLKKIKAERMKKG